ncbi:MAG: hypothetical protein LW850_19975 [Planctomycetaceae bacterium]|nr:hypothetical protein [Planctomycetaceae bacterium]MCE2812672.1 hypothetical protein [Planctomycetaceae bacterium]
MPSSLFDIEAFDRATDGIFELFTPQQAQAILLYRGDPAIRDRIEKLAERNTEGNLTDAEKAEYEGYVRANKFISTLQAKARKRLSNG